MSSQVRAALSQRTQEAQRTPARWARRSFRSALGVERRMDVVQGRQRFASTSRGFVLLLLKNICSGRDRGRTMLGSSPGRGVSAGVDGPFVRS